MKNRNIRIEYSKDNKPIIKVANLYLHSKFYPEREAKKFADENIETFNNKDEVIVYGLGLGYHIKEILLDMPIDSKLYVFDVDTEIFDIGKKLGCYKEIVKDRRLKLNVGIENIKKLAELKDVNDILVYSPCLKVLPDKYQNIKIIFQNFVVSKNKIHELKDIMKLNYINNLKEDSFSMRKFYSDYIFRGESIIIVLSGPSLDLNLKELQSLNGHVKIFCAGSALKTLIESGITPNMICITDCGEIVKKQFVGYNNLNVPLCFLCTASRWVVANYNGPKYIFFNEENKYNDIIINTAKTVSVSLIDIAVKGGAKEIVLVGQDLAFLDNRTHTSSYKEIYNVEDVVEDNSKLYKKVKGVDGKFLNTRWEYINFKYSIERKIEENPQVRFMNCSSGAEIKGTTYIKLSNWKGSKRF
ncbi:DUF115 domain-containing protein [Clostridium fermenticellae]|uniref:DUF115 domain-containing protein n=1 Tax=Clostridium fermenticellae TaxID=2068654 RepID=A0A386H765_9CLOT|nr:6-hydroxymethylpterin diphosphokinase MptE-like protein [Clostridium fermenticellae]AYD41454.1 DUF115 domain-containing protein [Clostridium fermenticellae]